MTLFLSYMVILIIGLLPLLSGFLNIMVIKILMNGGRKKWLEEDRPISKESPNFSNGNFQAAAP